MKYVSFSIALSLVLALAGASHSSADAARTVVASSACTGFSAESLASPSLASPFEVVSVEPITRQIGRVRSGTIVGARIAVRADPSLSRPGANRLLACRIAAAHATDPLAVEGSRVTVRDTSHGYLIDVTAPQATVGREVFARADALTTR